MQRRRVPPLALCDFGDLVNEGAGRRQSETAAAVCNRRQRRPACSRSLLEFACRKPIRKRLVRDRGARAAPSTIAGAIGIDAAQDCHRLRLTTGDHPAIWAQSQCDCTFVHVGSQRCMNIHLILRSKSHTPFMMSCHLVFCFVAPFMQG